MTAAPAISGIDSTLQLSDGRTLSYADCGNAAGTPVFFMHGTPGSRLIGSVAHEDALRCNVRLICPDRPGYGRSAFRRRSLLEYVDDVRELADNLGLDRFAVAGVSGGGPFTLACAAKIPERLTCAAIVSGVGPLDEDDAVDLIGSSDRSLIKLARRAPWAVHPVVSIAVFLMKPFADRLRASMVRSLPEADRASFEDPRFATALKEQTLEGLHHGTRGLAWDETLFSRPWGFRLEDIKTPVLLWQGEDDTLVLPEMGRRQNDAIPNCTATFCPGEGHFLIIAHLAEILSALAAQGHRGPSVT